MSRSTSAFCLTSSLLFVVSRFSFTQTRVLPTDAQLLNKHPTLPLSRRTSSRCLKVRYYTRHHLTSNDYPILPQLGWQVQPQSNTGNTLNLAWALGLNGLVGCGLANPNGPLPYHLHLKTLNLADRQPPFAPTDRLPRLTL